MKIYNEYQDQVINSQVLLADVTYDEAMRDLFPLVNRLDAQRKLLDNKFYKRLERDIIDGCIMPPITIAFVNSTLEEIKNTEEYVKKNIADAYILDGIQRLNTLSRAQGQLGFDGNRQLLLNIIISPSKDMLLYRMITLNNGQKPMTPRHQIEMLTQELFDFSSLDITVQTEKERSEKVVQGSFNLGDVSRGYLAFLTDNVHNENTKIIGEKMDQILVGRILDSNITSSKVEFQDVIKEIDRLANDNEEIKKWLKTSNNLIGFCVGIKKNIDAIRATSTEDFNSQIEKFEESFKAINPSKVNLGKFRRDLSKYFISNYNDVLQMDSDELIERFAEITI